MQPARLAVRDWASIQLRSGFLFAGYVVLYAGVSYLTNSYVITDDLLRADWSASFDAQRVAAMFDKRRSWILVGYAIIPASLLAKILYTSIWLWTGCALADWRVRFADIFRTALHAEIVFGIAAVVHLGGSLLASDNATFVDLMTTYPLSALHFVDLEAADMWMAYPLKTLNLFEAVYIFALARGLQQSRGGDWWPTLSVAGLSYGTGLLLLVSAVTFLALYFL